MKNITAAGLLAILIIAIGIFVNILAITGCSSRKAAIQKSVKASSSDSLALTLSKQKLIDTSRKESLTRRDSFEDYDVLTTIYPSPGAVVNIAPDGSFTGRADSARTKRRSKTQKQETTVTKESAGRTYKTVDQLKVNTRKQSAETSSSKNTERKGASFSLSLSCIIITIVAAIMIYARYKSTIFNYAKRIWSLF